MNTDYLKPAIETALKFVEEMALPPSPIFVTRKISENILPALFRARTYIEAGEPHNPEVGIALKQAADAAIEVSEDYPKLARLLSTVRILQEKVQKG